MREKTLEVWVQLKSVTQRGGGVMTVQTVGGVTFDSIVFGEREPARWMAGSNGFVRSSPFGGPNEVDAVKRPVHIAITYKADGTIAAYRDGRPYGSPYKSRGLVTYKAGQAQVVFGVRHGQPGANMVSLSVLSVQQQLDILSYAQTLPTK